jgi:[NiFe] hydrogenase assembly HybE family chaperone
MYQDDPSGLIESTFRRIHAERMAGLPLLNPALEVAAVGFALVDGGMMEWRGVLVTPWCINLLLLPATTDWTLPNSHERVFREYPAGTFGFLGNHEDPLGDYLICPLIHDMKQFADQESAQMTARACLIALDLAPGQGEADAAAAAPDSPSRRKLFGLRG